jgi:L-lactate dehydrogenase (cytochrome)
VDTVVAGNRERDYRTGMTTPPRMNLRGLLSFAAHPGWTLNYLLRERFDLPNISQFISAGSRAEMSVVDYINTQMKRSIHWDDAAAMIEEWGGPFAIKGVMSVADARRCVDIGASAIMVSNHGGRQLDGSRLAMGANACSAGRFYLYPLAAAGYAGVERAMALMQAEIERDMLLMGCRSLAGLDRSCLASRQSGPGTRA